MQHAASDSTRYVTGTRLYDVGIFDAQDLDASTHARVAASVRVSSTRLKWPVEIAATQKDAGLE